MRPRRDSDGGKILGGLVFEASEEAGPSQNRVYLADRDSSRFGDRFDPTRDLGDSIDKDFHISTLFFLLSDVCILPLRLSLSGSVVYRLVHSVLRRTGFF